MSRSARAAEAAPPDLASLDPAEAATLFAPFASHEGVLLAVSGGPDSTALMLLAQRWKAQSGAPTRLHVATVDHGLRVESRAEGQAVGALATRLGLPHALLDLPAPLPGTRLQEAARHERYQALAAHAGAVGASAIATAHTSDDQAETVLFRMMRGSGIGGLAGMRAQRPLGPLTLLRPLLAQSKAELVALCRAAGIGFVEDPSNSDPRFARARLRTLLPSLAAEGLDAAAMERLARRMARAEAALEAATDDAAAALWPVEEAAPIRLARPGFAALPEEIALRLLGRAVAAAGEGPVELAKLEALAGWIAALGAQEQGARTLAGALVRVNRRAVTVCPAPARRPLRQRL